MYLTKAGGRRRLGHSIVWIGCVLLCTGELAMAGWFSSDKPREEVHRRLDKAQAERFVSLVQLRSDIAEELVVFTRVQGEKQTEIAGYDERFIRDYRINPDQHYRYDPSSNALIRIEEEVDTEGVTNVVERFDRTYSQELGDALLKDMVGKTLASQQLRSLALLIREKNQEHALVNQSLLQQFGIDPAAKYRFDSDKGIIYVTVDKKAGKEPKKPAPSSSSAPKKQPVAKPASKPASKPAAAPSPKPAS
jgi:hypothetical protein